MKDCKIAWLIHLMLFKLFAVLSSHWVIKISPSEVSLSEPCWCSEKWSQAWHFIAWHPMDFCTDHRSVSLLMVKQWKYTFYLWKSYPYQYRLARPLSSTVFLYCFCVCLGQEWQCTNGRHTQLTACSSAMNCLNTKENKHCSECIFGTKSMNVQRWLH